MAEFFCCVEDDDAGQIDMISVYGTDFGDEIRFNYDSETYNLQPADDEGLDAYVWGSSGGDNIRGSNCVNGEYTDWLYGQDGDDTVFGNQGDDQLDGGPDEDTLVGGEGNDFIYGGDHIDTLLGNAGDDYLFGEGAKDYMAGGDDDDHLDGGDGGDVMCGDEHDDGDHLYDGDSVSEPVGTDQLWGHEIVDYDQCTFNTNSRSDQFGAGGCITSLTARPLACP